MEKICKDTSICLEKLSNEYSKIYSKLYEDKFYLFVRRYKIDSPIEQILCASIIFMADTKYIDDFETGTLFLSPQKKIGEYMVDFLIEHRKKDTVKKMVIECDSQEFHERTETERRYEKKRDRYLQSSGYKVFRYTGKEIKENNLNISSEILDSLI